VPLKATGAGIASAVRDSGLLSVGLGYVIFMLALWAGATHTLNALTVRKAGEERIDIHELLLDNDFKIFRQNFLFFLILFIGAYLSLASIAAIPDLREEEGAVPAGFSGATLAESLNKVEWGVDAKRDVLADPLALADSVFYPGVSALAGRAAPSRTVPADTVTKTEADSTPPAIRRIVDSNDAAEDGDAGAEPGTAGDGVAHGEEDDAADGAAPPAAAPDGAAADSLAGDSARAGAPAVPQMNPAIPPAQVLALRTAAEEIRGLWIDQTVRHDSVVRSLARRRNTARQLAQSAYVVADTTRRLREQRTYYHRLQRWYLESQMELQGEYDESWLVLRRLHSRAEAWSTAVAGYLTGPGPDSAQFLQLRRDVVRLRAEDWLLAETPARTLARLPDRGAGLGPFQYVSGWLLKTDSMPLTLIVGMVGFGLLGAAASTFVREQTRRERREARRLRRLEKAMLKRGAPDPHLADEMRKPGDDSQPIHPVQPLVLNLPSVVIRGGSAAIVVFLGLMGGLSVLTQEADPNPYALLFTCLAGAVFSEKVWSWAEKRFGLNLESDESDRDEDDDAEDGADDDTSGGGAGRPGGGNGGGGNGGGGGGRGGNGGGGNGGGGNGGGGGDGGGGNGGGGAGDGGGGDGGGDGGGENGGGGDGNGRSDGEADEAHADGADPTRPAEIHVVPPTNAGGQADEEPAGAGGAEGAVG
jgi:hypothetical protein